MVKQLIKFILPFLVSFFLFNSCNNDLLGIFASNDLDERLKAKDTFNFLTDTQRNNLSLGDVYSFIVHTDTHIEGGDAFGLEKLADIISNDSSIKFAVNLGDITQNAAREDFEKFISIANSMGVPCYPVIGNHDVYFGNWPIWKELIGSTSYRVDADTATLFILDTGNSFFGKAQLDWLERQIKNTKERVFVFTHSPLFVEGPVNIQQVTDAKERARIISILHNKCDMMFMGHLHKRIERTTANVMFIAMEDFKSKKIYCRVDVTPSSITYNFLKAD